MAARKKIKLKICGMEYVIVSEEPESYVYELAQQVDRAMNGLMEKDPRVSTTMSAILTSLTFADQARKSDASADNLRSQLKDYLADNARAREDAEKARREADNLRTELNELRKKYVPGYKTSDSGFSK